MPKPAIRIIATIAGLCAALLIVWSFRSLHCRLVRDETMTQILLTVQPGTKLADVERELGARARVYAVGQKPYDDFPLEVGPDESVADFDSYQLPEFIGVMDFWVIVDKQDRVVTMRVRSYPIAWQPIPPRLQH